MMEEMWIEIAGSNGKYFASDMGRIKSVGRYLTNNVNGGQRFMPEKIVSPKTKSNGYLEVSLHFETQKSVSKYVHRLVAEAFIPNPSNKETVNHINGIKKDNCVANLEWCTQSENTRHAYRTGLNKPRDMRGSLSPMAKLTEYQVRQIREDKLSGTSSIDLAKKYNISRDYVNSIARKGSWKHIW